MTDSDKKNSKSTGVDKNAAGSVSKESGRRKLLKAGGIVASSALVPEKWQKPVVDSIVLPAHAVTSTVLIGAVVLRNGANAADSMMAEPGLGVLDTMIQPASAGGVMAPMPSCAALGECATVGQPDSSNQIAFSISGGVGSTTLTSGGGLTYSGNLNGIAITNTFTDQSFTTANGTLSGNGCDSSYNAVLGGQCTPITATPSPTPIGTPGPTPSPTMTSTPAPTVVSTPSPTVPFTPAPTVTPN